MSVNSKLKDGSLSCSTVETKLTTADLSLNRDFAQEWSAVFSVKTTKGNEMELLILALLAILVAEEIRAFLSRKRFAAMMAKQALLAQELQAVEAQVANEWVCRATYELECQ